MGQTPGEISTGVKFPLRWRQNKDTPLPFNNRHVQYLRALPSLRYGLSERVTTAGELGLFSAGCLFSLMNEEFGPCLLVTRTPQPYGRISILVDRRFENLASGKPGIKNYILAMTLLRVDKSGRALGNDCFMSYVLLSVCSRRHDFIRA
jgi:hypothetical protein